MLDMPVLMSTYHFFSYTKPRKTRYDQNLPNSYKTLEIFNWSSLKKERTVYRERKYLWRWIQEISLIMPPMPFLSLSTKYFCIQLIPPPHDESDAPIPWLSLRDSILGKLTEIYHGSSIFKLWTVQDFCVNINFSRLLLPESFRSYAYNLCLL